MNKKSQEIRPASKRTEKTVSNVNKSVTGMVRQDDSESFGPAFGDNDMFQSRTNMHKREQSAKMRKSIPKPQKLNEESHTNLFD